MTNEQLRSLCAELYQCVEHIDRTCDVPIPCGLLDRARAALSPAPQQGPSVADYCRSEIDVVESCAGFTNESTPVGEAWARIVAAMERTRYGAQAAPQQPSDEELHDCKNQAVGDYLRSLAGTNAAIFSAEQITKAQAVGLRAVLTRYGAQAAPVPVAEKWPEFSDCDGDETLWCWHPVNFHWCRCRIDPSAHTHWLPHYALPLPEAKL